jgi:hypothetical protein
VLSVETHFTIFDVIMQVESAVKMIWMTTPARSMEVIKVRVSRLTMIRTIILIKVKINKVNPELYFSPLVVSRIVYNLCKYFS